jgi:hypothetical protein
MRRLLSRLLRGTVALFCVLTRWALCVVGIVLGVHDYVFVYIRASDVVSAHVPTALFIVTYVLAGCTLEGSNGRVTTEVE